MEKSKVYFTDMHTHNSISLPDKLKKLIKKAGIGTIDMEDKFVAIKIHFGEPGNLAFLRPNFAKAVADVVKEQKGLPFLTDCNTLYVGRRKHALEHLEAAQENGELIDAAEELPKSFVLTQEFGAQRVYLTKYNAAVLTRRFETARERAAYGKEKRNA